MFADTIRFTELSNTDQAKENGTVVDYGNSDQGYVYVKQSSSKKRLKLRIIKDDQTYTYDLNSDGAFEAFPLQMGSGKYSIKVFEQVSGNKYSSKSSLSIKVDLEDEDICYLYPSQFVDYGPDTLAVKKSIELASGLSDKNEIVDAMVEYISSGYVYDYMKALTIQSQSTYLPALDDIYNSRNGICFDFTAMLCSMLRVQGIPTKMIIGYADKAYHAWNRVYINGQWKLIDITSQITSTTINNYTEERSY